MQKVVRLVALCVLAGVQTCVAQTSTLSQYQQVARDIFRELVEIKSTQSGVGSTPAAEAVARRLLAAGYPSPDVHIIGPSGRKQNLVVHLHGKTNAKPILLFVHLDVVEARKEDWSPDLDPFRLVEHDGYFYGRGTQDIKDCVAILVTNFIRWKQEGWVPERDLILALTADEEDGDADGLQWLLQNHRDIIDAEYALNVDVDPADFRSKDGKPYFASIVVAEKKYTELELRSMNRGGHGSLPRKDNAIYDLVFALDRVRQFQFPASLSEITRAQFAAMAKLESGQVAADMKAVAENPDDDAIARLSQDPYYNALLRTTCVPTMIEGGHATNALPQSARAVLNCRLLPGQSKEDVLRRLVAAIGSSRIQATWQFEVIDTPASKLRPDVVSTLENVTQQLWPGVIVIPLLDVGASDAVFLRSAGIPTYGVSGVFLDGDDVRAHGRDERIRVRDFYAGLEFYDRFVKALAGK